MACAVCRVIDFQLTIQGIKPMTGRLPTVRHSTLIIVINKKKIFDKCNGNVSKLRQRSPVHWYNITPSPKPPQKKRTEKQETNPWYISATENILHNNNNDNIAMNITIKFDLNR